MPDGSERKGQSWETSPMDIAKEVSKSLSERVVIAKVRSILYNTQGWTLIARRLTATSGIWSGHWKSHVRCNYLISNTPKENAYSGIPRPTFSEKLPNGTTDAICASAPRQTTAFSTKWLLKTGPYRVQTTPLSKRCPTSR